MTIIKHNSAQEIQDKIFRKMSAERKIKMASDLFELAKILKKSNYQNGSHKTISKTGKNL